MNLSLYIAKRYLFSKKSHHAINVISGVSVCGVALATMALVCTLSIFNGFQDLVATLFTAFDPQLKITSVSGKVFDSMDTRIQSIKLMPEVEVFSESLEDNAMVQYKGRQTMVVVKGVQDNFNQLTAIDSILYGNGKMVLHDDVADYGIPGIELVSVLGTGISFHEPWEVYAPKRGQKVNLVNPSSSFQRSLLYSTGLVFAVNQQKYDASHVLTSLSFAQKLFQYSTEISSIELKLRDGYNVDDVKDKLSILLGADFLVQDRYEQQEDTYRIMEIEKVISYLFLTFILLVACFNVIGSLSMLILEKREDVEILKKMGADKSIIFKIFLFEGFLISFIGALLGLVTGLALCLVQQEFGIIALGSDSSSFIVDAYPVSVHLSDVLGVLLTVLIVGLLSVLYPVRYLAHRLLDNV